MLGAAPVAAQQDELVAPVQAPPPVAPDSLAQARTAATRGDPAEALSRYLRILAEQPDDVAALAGAGQAALDVGDLNAAAGFFARADARDPRNGAVKTGLARTLIQRDDPRAALRLFREAVDLGVPAASIAADRGLAYDLRGSPVRAQADYQLALRSRPDDDTVRRLALSQAIAGDRATALATLDPLLRRQDVPAWRARAFVLALTGDPADAQTAAGLVMPRDQVLALAPYLPRLAALKAGDKAAAIHLGRFPGDVPPPTRIAAAAPIGRPVPDGSAMPLIAPAAPVATVVPTAEDDRRARERALADALAAARARAAAIRATRRPLPAVAAASLLPAPPLTVSPPPPSVSPAPLSSALSAPLSALPASSSAPVSAPPSASPAMPSSLASAPLLPSAQVQAAGPLSYSLPPAGTQAGTAPSPSLSPVAPPSPAPPPVAGPAPEGAPAPAAAPPPTRREELAARRRAQAEAAARKQEADARRAEAEAERARRREPARHWVQVAGGANRATLPRAWADLKTKWPKQLAGRAPWTLHYRYTNRLLIGPFPSSDAAQDWVSERRKEGFATFRVETEAGDPVERVRGG